MQELKAMMQVFLFDGKERHALLPFTHIRPVAELLCGMQTMGARWSAVLNCRTGVLTQPYLQQAYAFESFDGAALFINSAVFGTSDLGSVLQQLKPGEALWKADTLLGFVSDTRLQDPGDIEALTAGFKKLEYPETVMAIRHSWDIFRLNAAAIELDFAWITRHRKSQPLPPFVQVSGNAPVFIEAGATLRPCMLNAESGPIYIGKEAEVMEGCLIRGPLVLLDHAVLKMGTKVYGATTIGAGSKVGGELNNVVVFSNSNKGHDGFLGNAVIGSWCNLGADTNCSNLKNNYDEVRVWSEQEMKYIRSGLQFCGLLMGDHSKCGINTMFNTGTVVGVSCNVFGSDFPAKFIPSFSWGGSAGMHTYQLDKAVETADRMMGRRGLRLEAPDRAVLSHIFQLTGAQRDLLH